MLEILSRVGHSPFVNKLPPLLPPPPPGRPGADDVAREAGVSVITVRRVFRNSGLVTEATRDAVLAAAERVGYTPNYAARALSTGRTHAVALVQASHHTMRGDYHAEFLCGFQNTLIPHKLDLLLSVVPPDQLCSGHVRQLVAERRCDAVVVIFDRLDQVDEPRLARLPVPALLINNTPAARRRKTVSSIGYDNFTGTALAVRHLVELGHSQIAFFGAVADWPDSVDREQAFRSTLEEYGIDLPEEWVVRMDLLRASELALEAMEALITSGICPTAVVCAHDALAVGIYRALSRHQMSVPRDVSVIGHYDVPGAEFLSPPLSTIRQSGYELGEEAARLLLNLRAAPGLPRNRSVVLPTSLVWRESTAPPRPLTPVGWAAEERSVTSRYSVP